MMSKMQNDKNHQLIFCIETTEKAKIDQIYLDEIIKHYFKGAYSSNKIKRSYVYMESKNRYNHSKTINTIKGYRNSFDGISQLIYVCDKDQFDSVPQDAEFVQKLSSYCDENNALLIWFVRDIEHVMLGKQIADDHKRIEAIRFIKHHQIKETPKSRLNNMNPCSDKSSNALVILSRIFNDIQDMN